MNTDIRLSVEFFDHPKTVKLQRRLGLEAVICLQRLWLWAAQNRPEGRLSNMDAEDVEIAAKWAGETGTLCSTLVALGWLDEAGGQYSLHDWEEHNPPRRIYKARLDVPVSEWRRIRAAIFERDNGVCQYCGTSTENPDCDHVVPLSRGGVSVFSNLVTACQSCNRSKGARTPQEWMQ